ncbi:MAG: hypothetical protein WB992_03100 [Bryobacteraceae bacterium]
MFSSLGAYLLLLPLTALAQDAKPNFSGTWAVRDFEVDRIDHTEPTIAISPKIRRADVIPTFVFRTDGTEVRSRSGNNEVVRTGHWDGNFLVLETKWIGSGAERTEQDILSLSEDGKVMTKHTRIYAPDKEVDDMLQFRKTSEAIRGK